MTTAKNVAFSHHTEKYPPLVNYVCQIVVHRPTGSMNASN